MIEYFHLIDILTEEVFFEADYRVASLTEDQIWEIVDERKEERQAFERLFEERYPNYSGLGEGFRNKAVDQLILLRNRSRMVQDIALAELYEMDWEF